ncbi:unnamed protein product, partial [Pylaiella littoralis]
QHRAHAALCSYSSSKDSCCCLLYSSTAVLSRCISTSVVACLLEHGVSSCCRSVDGTTTTMSRKRTCRTRKSSGSTACSPVALKREH